MFSEAIKLKDGIFYNLEYHQARLNRTQEKFYSPKIDLSLLCSLIPDYPQKGLFKCRLAYHDEIEKIEFIPYTFKIVDKVGVVIDNEIDYEYKYTNRDRLNYLLENSGCDDIIIIKNGYITDSFSSNLIFKSDEGWFTPDTFLLSGTKRQLLLDKGIIKERKISLEDVKQYQQIYFINAMVDIEDNISIDVQNLNLI